MYLLVVNNRYSSHHKSSSNFVFALAHELKQYMEENAHQFDSDTWDSLSHWRSGILSQGIITDEDLSEIIDYIGIEKLQELISTASSKTA